MNGVNVCMNEGMEWMNERMEERINIHERIV